MELVEGQTLADRIAEGPIETDEAIAIARQIATALEVAHDAGIVHRDLKPANVKVRPDGTVKVLDFGLAKAVEPAGAGSPDVSPTITSPALVTGAGVLLGTAGYMAPEQARGKAVDKRADIWAFGAVLYEMLTGDRLWAGETNLDVLAQVVHREPALERVPAHLRPLLRRCLEKDPRRRLRDISSVELLLEGPVNVSAPRSRLPAVSWIAAGVLAVALAAVTWSLWPAPAVERPPVEFSLEAPPDSTFSYIFPGAAVSRDGRLLAFTAGSGGVSMLWLRPVGSRDAHPLKGTEGANFPFWSPDGKSLAFLSMGDRGLKRTDVVGGTPQRLCDTIQPFEGGDWSRQGVILFSSGGLIHQVRDAGGTCTAATRPDAAGVERHTWPHVLPDGRTFLYVVRSSDRNVEGVYASSLDRPDQRTKLLSTDKKALYAPPHDGHPGFLLWVRERTLVAQRFDPDELRLEGDPVAVAEEIRSGGGTGPDGAANRAAFWVSDNGLLMYRTGSVDGRSLVWLDRDGKQSGDTAYVEERTLELANTLRTSPDVTRIAAERTVADVSDMWVYTIARRVWSKLTSTPGREATPAWSHDGRQVAYSAERDGSSQLYRIDANGAGKEERLTDGPNYKRLLDWSRDGRYLIYAEVRANQPDLWILPFDMPNGRPGTPIPFRTTDAAEDTARFSPDGKWIAYTSNVTGRAEAYIAAFPGGPPGDHPVSSNGAATLIWRADGRELFFRQASPGGSPRLLAVPVRLLADRPDIGTPQQLFGTRSVPLAGATSVASDDGRRFLVFALAGALAGDERGPLTIRLNWQAALK